MMLSFWKKCVEQCIKCQDELCDINTTANFVEDHEDVEMTFSWI